MKHIWFAWMMIVMLVFVSCSNAAQSGLETSESEEGQIPNPTPTKKPTPKTTPTEQAQSYLMIDPEDLAGISVRFVHPWTGEGAVALKSIATEFSISNPWDIWIDVESYGGETAMLEGLQADLQEGNPPGLIALHPYLLSSLKGDYYSANLSHYFYDPDWGFNADAQADIPPVFLDQFLKDSDLIALPIAPQATVLYYNQTWAEELGFSTAPVDEKSFREQSCAATTANWQDDEKTNGTGGWVVSLAPNTLLSWYRAFEGELPVGETPKFNNDAGRAAFGYLKSLMDPPNGCIWNALQPEPYTYFVNRSALMYAGTLDQIPLQMGWSEIAESEDDWTVMGFPGSSGTTMLVDGPGLLVTVDSPEEQMAAWLFARHLLEPDVQAKLVQKLFTLPVRRSSLDKLKDFEVAYPQWAKAVEMIDDADPVPVSLGWGIGQWVMQDAIYRLFQTDVSELSTLLRELDRMILELEETSP